MHFAKRLCYSFFERGYAGNLPIKRPIRGLGQASRLHKTVVVIHFHNAAMQAIYKSNVRFADWVKRHACGLPTTAAVADCRHGSAKLAKTPVVCYNIEKGEMV